MPHSLGVSAHFVCLPFTFMQPSACSGPRRVKLPTVRDNLVTLSSLREGRVIGCGCSALMALMFGVGLARVQRETIHGSSPALPLVAWFQWMVVAIAKARRGNSK